MSVQKKPLKDFEFCIENILNNLDYVLSRIDLRPRGKEIESMLKTLRDIIDKFREEEKKNRNLHRLTDKILDEFSNIVNTLTKVIEEIERSEKNIQLVEKLEKIVASCVRMLSRVDVLSLEIEECSEMRWWKDNYEKIRSIVYYLIWLTYFLLMYILYEAYRSTDGSGNIVDEVYKRSDIMKLIHRALMR
ncbi:MAG: hypothetical protein GXO10_01410 [Crenarchaeota archaeon]|nr:hypothetical protein [Thermoproteota archaeon]